MDERETGWTDASSIGLKQAGSIAWVPARLLAIGLPLTIGAGALVGWLLFPALGPGGVAKDHERGEWGSAAQVLLGCTRSRQLRGVGHGNPPCDDPTSPDASPVAYRFDSHMCLSRLPCPI